MAKQWTTYDHPSDLGLSANADSLGELFEALGEGLAEQICPIRLVRSRRRRNIRVQAETPEELLVEFLARLHRLFTLEKFLLSRVRVKRMDERELQAELSGEAFDPGRHELGPEIKAVTYHNLKVARAGERWVGQVLLDL